MSENTRMAKISGKWEQVELVWGDCDSCIVLISKGNKIEISSRLVETVEEYPNRLRREAARAAAAQTTMTDKTLVIDPDMAGTY